MNINEVTFDNFLNLSLDEQNLIMNDTSLLQELVRKNVSEKRFKHILSTANTCVTLAKYHDVDIKKAYMAGLLHDVCKFPNSDTSGVLEKYLQVYEPQKLNNIYGAYHSWVAPYYLKEKLHYFDDEVLDAIYNHTIIVNKTKLNLILYISDKREATRDINDDILDIAKKDLNKAYDLLVKDVEEFVKSKNEKFIGNSL